MLLETGGKGNLMCWQEVCHLQKRGKEEMCNELNEIEEY